jgi:hypothetical protein
MIARSKIDRGKYFGTSQLIKENINAGQGIFILDCHRIEWVIVHTHPQTTIFLFSQKERGFPKEKNLGGHTLYQAILAIDSSTRLALWVAFGKVF